MRRGTGLAAVVTVTVLAIVGAGCGGDDPVVSGDTTEVPGGASGEGELALPRCDDVPELGTATEAPVLSDDPEVAQWQQSRAEVGLPSDEASTRAAAANPATDGVEPPEAFGFPMTQAEADAFFGHQEANGDLAGEVQTAISGEPWFAGLWLDNVRQGIGVGVVGDVAAIQAELDAQFGAGAVLAVPAQHSQAELAALQAEVSTWLEATGIRYGGIGSGGRRNVVAVFLEVLDPTVVDDLAAEFGTDALCVDGAEPDEVIPEGPQAQDGDGWRLLADEPGAGMAYASGFAGDQAAYDALWAQIGLPGEPPAVDFSTEVVAWFGPAVSGSCPEIRLVDVAFDEATATLGSEIVLTGGMRSCTDDANPHAYVVAFDRTRLPDRFTVSVGPPNDECCPEATTEVDLSSD